MFSKELHQGGHTKRFSIQENSQMDGTSARSKMIMSCGKPATPIGTGLSVR